MHYQVSGNFLKEDICDGSIAPIWSRTIASGSSTSSGKPGNGNAEADEIKRDDRRKPAEHIAIDDGERPNRLAGRARQQARDRHDQSPDQHQDFGNDEDEDVVPEGFDDERPFLEHQGQEEKSPPDRHVVDEQKRDEAEHHERECAPAEGETGPVARLRRDRCALRRHRLRSSAVPAPPCESHGADRRPEQAGRSDDDRRETALPSGRHNDRDRAGRSRTSRVVP